MWKKGILCIIGILTLTASVNLNPATDASTESPQAADASIESPQLTDALTESPQKTFVLVHGAFGDQAVWDGPHTWKGVAEQLRRQGYRVITPTLPGLGRNHRQADPSIDLKSHIQHVVDILKIDEVTDAVVVCHSYSGMVCAGVQDRVPERIAKMVFFDAVVPVSGDSFLSSIGTPLPDWFPTLQTYYRLLGVPVPEKNLWCFPSLPADSFGLTEPEDLAWLNKRQHCQPIRTFDQPLSFSWRDEVEKYFIHVTQPWFSYRQFLLFKERAMDMGWNMYSVDASHYVSISDPDETVRILTLISRTPYEDWQFN